MKDFIMEGGWGMLLTMPLGFALIVAVLASIKSSRSRAAELVVPLGVATLTSGFFGFVLGLRATFGHIGEVGGNGVIAMTGAGESLANLALAFGMVLTAAIVMTIGRAMFPRPDAERAHAN